MVAEMELLMKEKERHEDDVQNIVDLSASNLAAGNA